jgi:hypothetical protein
MTALAAGVGRGAEVSAVAIRFHVQGCPDFRQTEPLTSTPLPRPPVLMDRDLLIFHQPIQSGARDAEFPHHLTSSDHRFVPHAPSVTGVPIVPLVPALGRMVHLEHTEQQRGAAHVSERQEPYAVPGDSPRARKRWKGAKLRLRFRVLERDGWRCHWCGTPARETKLVIDHVHPFSKGGADNPSNYCASCEPCNGGKGDVILEVRNDG